MTNQVDDAIRAAVTDYVRGAYQSAIRHGQAALERLGPDRSAASDRRRVRAIEVLVLASEPWWHADPAQPGALPLADLVAEAEAAAQRVGDPALLAIAGGLGGACSCWPTASNGPSPRSVRRCGARASAMTAWSS